MIRVSAGLKEWTRCLLGMADVTADNTDAPTGFKPGGDPILQVNVFKPGTRGLWLHEPGFLKLFWFAHRCMCVCTLKAINN